MFSQELKTLTIARLNISACHLPRGSGALVHRGACVHWASRCLGAGGDDPRNLQVLAVICCPFLHEANVQACLAVTTGDAGGGELPHRVVHVELPVVGRHFQLSLDLVGNGRHAAARVPGLSLTSDGVNIVELDGAPPRILDVCCPLGERVPERP